MTTPVETMTSYQHSEHTSYRCIYKSEMSHKQFNNSMNYETDSMLNWKKTSCNNYSLQCIIYYKANGQLAMAYD